MHLSLALSGERGVRETHQAEGVLAMVSSVLMVLVAVLASPSAASTVLRADPSRSVVLGRARFTVLIESMLRMEASKRSTSPTFDGASPCPIVIS